MLDGPGIYDALYGLAAGGQREQALFGDCAPLAHQAFVRSLAGDEFPLLWFEVPLSGDPRFDLHVALSRSALKEGVQFLAGAGNGYDALLDWYACEEQGGGGLAFAYDVSEGKIDNPAVHVNVNRVPLSDMGRFFDLAAGAGAAQRYASFAGSLVQGWCVWYAGVHPGRPGSPVRVDCFVNPALKDAYADDLGLFERDLQSCGFSATGPALRELAEPILASPFALELQFDVLEDGTPSPTLGMSAAFSLGLSDDVHALFEEPGAGARLMGEIEGLGLSDGRWRHVPDTAFSKLVALDGDALAMFCAPTFVKLRMRDGEALDAKMYLQAGASVLA